MKRTIQFQIHKGDKYYIAECIDLPIVTQGLTLDELIFNIQEAVELHLEEDDLENYFISQNPTIMANMEIGEYHYA